MIFQTRSFKGESEIFLIISDTDPDANDRPPISTQVSERNRASLALTFRSGYVNGVGHPSSGLVGSNFLRTIN